jgi:hypothetical protein
MQVVVTTFPKGFPWFGMHQVHMRGVKGIEELAEQIAEDVKKVGNTLEGEDRFPMAAVLIFIGALIAFMTFLFGWV